MLARHKAIDWRGFAGLRDVVAHQYFGLELPRLWPTITDEVPVLIAAVAAEIARLSRRLLTCSHALLHCTPRSAGTNYTG